MTDAEYERQRTKHAALRRYSSCLRLVVNRRADPWDPIGRRGIRERAAEVYRAEYGKCAAPTAR